MKTELSYYAERLWSRAARRKDVNHYAHRKSTNVYWVVRRDEWIVLRWCTITEYNNGVIRFTKCFTPHPPRQLWPFDSDTRLKEPLEITLAAAELDEEKFRRLADVFTYPQRALDWELLDWANSDWNRWSDKAVAAQKELSALSLQRRVTRRNV